MTFSTLTEEFFNKLSKTDLGGTVVNLQDTMESLESNLIEEVQKLDANFEILKSDFSTTRIENNYLNEGLTTLKRQC